MTAFVYLCNFHVILWGAVVTTAKANGVYLSHVYMFSGTSAIVEYNHGSCESQKKLGYENHHLVYYWNNHLLYNYQIWTHTYSSLPSLLRSLLKLYTASLSSVCFFCSTVSGRLEVPSVLIVRTMGSSIGAHLPALTRKVSRGGWDIDFQAVVELGCRIVSTDTTIEPLESMAVTSRTFPQSSRVCWSLKVSFSRA